MTTPTEDRLTEETEEFQRLADSIVWIDDEDEPEDFSYDDATY